MAPFLLSASGWAGPVVAQELELGLPVDCTLNQSCYIQQYVDRDPGPGRLDFGCGAMANDKHRGTDFAVPTLADMRRGMDVIAAAPGRVRGVRDGMLDISVTDPSAPDVSGRECGNGVVIVHEGGWETQYCHLRQGSVSVKTGDLVKTGDKLGLLGMSGQATYPHVHFTVRNQGAVIDPFVPDGAESCGALTGDNALWSDTLEYRPGGLLLVGLADRVPKLTEIQDGLEPISLPPVSPKALVLWGYAYAVQKGDQMDIILNGPEGSLGHEKIELTKTQVFVFRAWGRRAPPGGFKSGHYSGEVIHTRGDRELGRQSISVDLR